MRCLIILILLFAGFVGSAQKEYSISGDIRGLTVDKMFMIVQDAKAVRGFRLDTIFVHDEKFTYRGKTDKAQMLTFGPRMKQIMKMVGESGFIGNLGSNFNFYAEPCANIHFTGVITDYIDAYPSGTKTNNELSVLNKQITPILNQAANYRVVTAGKIITDSGKVKQLNDSIKLLGDNVVAIKKKFIHDYPSSVISVVTLEEMNRIGEISGEEMKVLFKTLNRQVLGNDPVYNSIAERLRGLDKTKIGEQVLSIISSSTPTGKTFDIKSLRGKYIILDFWGTWCQPCVQGMPDMKTYRDRNVGKLEILSIAKESDKGEKWKKMISESGFNWYHILNTEKNDYVSMFNITGFPTKIIIDPKGKILARFVGENDKIYKKLDELLK